MRIRILGAGWYGCHLGAALLADGHEVEIHEGKARIFDGASGKIPARLHIGAHYPRSHQTRRACQLHTREFLDRYGFLTRGIAVNLYAIARDHSLVDFDQYVATLRGEFEFITVHDPAEYGLRAVEGAILTSERHIVARLARDHFEQLLGKHIRTGSIFVPGDHPAYDLTIDCTFCANDGAGVDRYEPCLVLQLRGPTDRAVTIMDGPFGSLYPWDPEAGLCSLSSALYTPFSKTIRTYEEAQALLVDLTPGQIREQGERMIAQMRQFYPAIDEFELVEPMLSIRAMPLSGADTRLVDVVRVSDRVLRVRAGKIDAVIDAERQIRGMLCMA
jgi:hypothetical protein